MRNDLSHHNLSMEDATELALDRPLWRLAWNNNMHCIGASRTTVMMSSDIVWQPGHVAEESVPKRALRRWLMVSGIAEMAGRPVVAEIASLQTNWCHLICSIYIGQPEHLSLLLSDYTPPVRHANSDLRTVNCFPSLQTTQCSPAAAPSAQLLLVSGTVCHSPFELHHLLTLSDDT